MLYPTPTYKNSKQKKFIIIYNTFNMLWLKIKTRITVLKYFVFYSVQAQIRKLMEKKSLLQCKNIFF